MNDKMKIIYKKVDELIPYINNPRNNDNAVDAVASSIKSYGFKVPIVIDSKNEIIAGHTRLKASKKLGLIDVPCIIADDLTEAEIKAFRIADNKVGELAEWNMDLLKIELETIDIPIVGFTDIELNDILNDSVEDENNYSKKIEAPIYEPKNEKPDIDALVDVEKTNNLLKKIDLMDIEEKTKDFLKKCAYRHMVFNYRLIADFYAHSDKVIQEVMEEMALVIIDFDKAIAYGYVKMNEEFMKQYKEEHDEI